MIPTAPEFSRRILVDQISSSGIEQRIEATPEECALLAARFGVLKVNSLSATLRLKAVARGALFRVRGQLSAEVVQSCVVTLEPLSAKLDEEFDVTFSPSVEEDEGDEIEFSMDEADPPDILVDGGIDMGEVVAEHLALSLDPFPRKAGAVLKSPAKVEVLVDSKPHPFAALEKLRQKNG